jgi:hypothetical protein
MKLITTISITVTASLMQNADCFVANKAHASSQSTAIALAEFLEYSLEEPILEEPVCLDSLRRKSFSKAIPFLKRPIILDGEYPGDFGFDPLGLASSKEDLIKYREAEVKHSRLAMLAAVGWPLSEIFDNKIASILNLPTALDVEGRAPSVLNNFEGISANYWFVVIATAAFIDGYGTWRSMRKDDPDYFPGNLGFDPLGLYPEDEMEQRVVQLAEIKHGRVAMMAVLSYGIVESLTGSSIIPALSK